MRLKLANTLGNRSASTLTDERILNGIAESQGGRRKDDQSLVFKRPALVSSYSLAVGQGSATTGQGIFVINTPGAPGVAGSLTLVGIRGDVLTTPVS